MRFVLAAALGLAAVVSPAAALPPISTPLQPQAITANTGEKPQSKVWSHDGRWWSVLPNATGTWIWRLDGTTWTNVYQLSTSTSVKADVKPAGNAVHVLLYQGTSSALASAEYVPGTQTYQAWTPRPANVPVTLDSGVETATLDIDSQGRMWIASDETDEIRVRHSDSPYSSWSAPISLVTGLNSDDISVVTALPNGTIGVLWSNQTTQRFGFRTHVDGDLPTTWSADEVPASQSALNVGLGMGDDHLNVAVASDATLYAAVKTSYDTGGFTKIALLVRRPGGTWDNLYEVDQAGTRGICLLDEGTGTVTVIYTSVEGSGDIVYKESPISSIAFGPTRSTLMSGAFNEVTSTRQNVSGSVVILASTTSGPLQAVGVLRSGTDAGPPSVTLTAPNGGEVWTAGTTQNVTWTASDDIGVSAVDVAYSTDGGTVWTPIVSGLANTGTYAWLVPNSPTSQARVRATAHDAALNQAQDASNANFQILGIPPAGDLVGWWPMEEGSGPTVQDVSGSGHHGTLPNGANWTAGVAGLSLLVNGTNQYASVPDHAELDMTTAITMAAWIRPEQFATQDIIKKGVISGSNGYELSLSAPSSTWPQKVFVRFNQVTSGDTYRINSTTLYPIDGSTWMHVAATYDGATMRLYVNGTLEGSLAMPPPIATNANPLGIGAQSDGARPFKGRLDDVRLYDRALSAVEIQALLGHTIAASAGAGGSVGPSGVVPVHHGADQSFTITANAGFAIADVVVDGGSVGAVTSHSFQDVQQNHTLVASFVDAVPPVISGLSAVPVTNTATVSWTTDEPATSRVDYGTSPGTLSSFVTSGVLETSHSLGLSLLTPGITYYYRVTSLDGAGNPATFPSLPDPPASFTTGALDLVAAVPPPGGAISNPTPCFSVPVVFTRTNVTPVLGYSVTVELSPELTLCGAQFTSAGYTQAPRQFLVTPLGGNRWTVDEVTLGTPCGATGSATLFTMQVTSAATLGTGTITVLSADVRDCLNQPVAASPGGAATITIDREGPAATTNLVAIQSKTGNFVPLPSPSHSTTPIRLEFSPPGDAASVEVYRRPFGGYPQYDENGGAVPLPPSGLPGPGWTLTSVTASTQSDEPTARDFWYYALVTRDAFGNVSPVSNLTPGTLNYHLGDWSNGLAACAGDDRVDIADVSLLGSQYGLTLPVNHALECLDVGPTTDHSTDGRPTTDNLIGFEDLVILALNYELVSAPQTAIAPGRESGEGVGPARVTLMAPHSVTAGQVFEARVDVRSDGRIHALSAALDWQASVVEPMSVRSGGFLESAGGVTFAAGPAALDGAVLGAASPGLAGEGLFAVVRFRAITGGDPGIRLGRVLARDRENQPLAFEDVRPGEPAPQMAPTVTRLLPAAPLPFTSQTTIAYSLAADSEVELAVFGIDGRQLRTLSRGSQKAGVHRITWDGTDDRGRRVAAGMYYARLSLATGRFTQPLIRIAR